MRKVLLVRFGEVYLKGLNRPYFLHALVERVKQAVPELVRLNGSGVSDVQLSYSTQREDRVPCYG